MTINITKESIKRYCKKHKVAIINLGIGFATMAAGYKLRDVVLSNKYEILEGRTLVGEYEAGVTIHDALIEAEEVCRRDQMNLDKGFTISITEKQ